MTRHERAVRKALKAFEPMVPPHVMTSLEKVIEGHLEKVKEQDKIPNYEVKGKYVGGLSGIGGGPMPYRKP